ncbi:MAG: response regulator [Sulfurimonas sp.]|nr:response regulator [Sulfurimonas sp.]
MGVKVIFVDDSQVVLNSLKAVSSEIEKSGLAKFSFFVKSEEVYDKLEKEELEYDLLFVDINMPKVSGYDLAKLAKSKEKYRFKPILAITTEHTKESKIKGKESGIDGWFVKSIEMGSLQDNIIKTIKKLSHG